MKVTSLLTDSLGRNRPGDTRFWIRKGDITVPASSVVQSDLEQRFCLQPMAGTGTMNAARVQVAGVLRIYSSGPSNEYPIIEKQRRVEITSDGGKLG